VHVSNEPEQTPSCFEHSLVLPGVHSKQSGSAASVSPSQSLSLLSSQISATGVISPMHDSHMPAEHVCSPARHSPIPSVPSGPV